MIANLVKLKALLQTYAVLDFDEISITEIEQLKITADEIIQMLKWDLKEKIAEDPDSYISDLQSHLTYLADGATAFDRASPNSVEFNEFVKFLTGRIYDLINHLKTYYPHLFDFEADIPSHYQDYLDLPCQIKLSALQNALIEKNVDDELISLILEFFRASNKTQRFQILTWRQWNFRENLYNVLMKSTEHQTCTDFTLETLKVLLAFELNSIQVYAYFIKHIEKISLGSSPLQEQEQDLLYLIKLYRQVRTEVKSYFDMEAPSLKASVLESLEAEVSYIKQKDEAILQSFKAADADGQNRFYFKVAFTLPELMFFFRILLEIGLMVTRFKSHLYEFISRNIETERADHISKRSMRNHFSSKPFPDRVVNSVKSWLKKAIDHIDLHYR